MNNYLKTYILTFCLFSSLASAQSVNCNQGTGKEDFTAIVKDYYVKEAVKNFKDQAGHYQVQNRIQTYAQECSKYLCSNFFGSNNNTKDLGCRNFPKNWTQMNPAYEPKDWNMKFNKDTVFNRYVNDTSCRNDSWGEISKKYKIDKDKAYYFMAKTISSANPNSVKAILDSCGFKFCQALKNNFNEIMCGDRKITENDIAKFELLAIANTPKDAASVSQGKEVQNCKWAKNLPRRVTTNCGGTCVGYVICDTQGPMGIISTMRMATCSADNCKEHTAQGCVDDKSVGTRTPTGEKHSNYIDDDGLIKASRQ
jgi:hypothetical protein